jgi:hypothetical protein
MHKLFVVCIDPLGKEVETISGVFARAKARAMHKLSVVRTDLLGKGVETIYATQLGNTLKGLREWSRLSASLPDGEGLREWNRLSALLLRMLFGRDKDGDGS